MAKDAFDRWWEWAEKPASSTLTIPAHFHEAVMQLPLCAAMLPLSRYTLRRGGELVNSAAAASA
jgi:hypothetical protein